MSWLTGRHAIEASIDRGAKGRLIVVRGASGSGELIKVARAAGIQPEYRDAQWLRQNVGGGARAFAFQIADSDETTVQLKDWLERSDHSKSSTLVLVLDHIQDPHNYGAILRTADLFAVDLVIVPAKRAVGQTDAVMRTSAGAAAYVPVAIESNINRAISLLKDHRFWIYGADMAGQPLPEMKFPERTVLVVGAEGKGIASHTRKICDEIVAIPTTGHVESLNVSVAAGVLTYEYRRQHTGR